MIFFVLLGCVPDYEKKHQGCGLEFFGKTYRVAVFDTGFQFLPDAFPFADPLRAIVLDSASIVGEMFAGMVAVEAMIMRLQSMALFPPQLGGLASDSTFQSLACPKRTNVFFCVILNSDLLPQA